MIMGAQIPVIDEKPLAACGCRKFQLDAMGDHLCTTGHSGGKKAHDWAVEQLADLSVPHITPRRNTLIKAGYICETDILRNICYMCEISILKIYMR